MADTAANAWDSIQRQYEDGLAGASWNPEAHAELLESIVNAGGLATVEEAATRYGFAESFAGKLVIPFVWCLVHFPGSLPGPAQQRGDCVSHGGKNAAMATYACEIASGQPDQVSGKIEIAPVISPLGLAQGAYATETHYWFSGNGPRDDGWHSAACVKVMTTQSGLVIRAPLGNTGIDLTRYSAETASHFGGKTPPADVLDQIDNNLIRTAAEVTTMEGLRDSLGKGFCVTADGSEGFDNVRDANGVSKQRGRWAHCMAELGFDERPETVKLYSEPLVLVQNSWNKFNSGPRDIRDSAGFVPPAMKELWIKLGIVNPATGNIMIPEGSFWTRWSSVKQRRRYAFAGVSGWGRQNLPDWNLAI